MNIPRNHLARFLDSGKEDKDGDGDEDKVNTNIEKKSNAEKEKKNVKKCYNSGGISREEEEDGWIDRLMDGLID